MKKQWIALALAAVMLCTVSPRAQAEEASVLDRITEANQLETILLSSPQVEMKADLYDAQGNITSWYRYADESLLVSETDAAITIHRDGQVFGFDNVEKRPYIILFLDNTQAENTMDGFSYRSVQGERVQSCMESNGALAVQTVVDDPEILNTYQEMLFEMGYENAQLKQICFSYVLDARTYRIKSQALFTELTDGSMLLLSEVRCLEQTQPYEIDPQLLDMLFSQDLRTVTVIADPGTQDETMYSVQVGKGCMVQVFCSPEHPNLYLDRECTQPVEFIDDYDSDLLLYTVRAERDILYSQTEGIQPYPQEDNMVWCEFCGKWYEAGNVFRNHICVGSEMQPYPEEEQCPACDAWYEAGTVHDCEIQPYPEEEQCQACGAWYEVGTTHTCGK